MPPTSTKPRARRSKLKSLPHELLAEIFSHLAPLDLFNVRKVCRKLYRTCKDREIWLRAHARYDYHISSIDVSSFSRLQLQKYLLRADVVKDVLTGRRSGKPLSIRRYEFIRPEDFVGLMKEHLVTCFHTPQEITWRWYTLEDSTIPVCSHTIAYGSALNKIIGWWGMIETDIDTLHIAYGVQQDAPGTQGRLRVESITLDDQSALKVTTRLNTEMASAILNGALPRASNGPSENFFPIIGYGFLVLPTEFIGLIHIFHLDSGELTSFNRHRWITYTDIYNGPSHSFHLTPWHLIEGYTSSHLFIHLLSTPQDWPNMTKKPYETQLPLSELRSSVRLDFFTNSWNLIYILALDGCECHLFRVNLDQALPDGTVEPQLCQKLALSTAQSTLPEPQSGYAPPLRPSGLIAKVLSKDWRTPLPLGVRLSVDDIPLEA
ncbi:hypothetical protein NP233_g12394 [Leucocoprinus birnbaumii]|uniref:F-box domain-containing protein n=1 Tax=Leucocoprinus birnbaumii TaxID=56174 RepID=A0AAD5VK88_9AGAR|nr:hypothetical protein NP233_g12394 [Leucocoprinus birnbaumii]